MSLDAKTSDKIFLWVFMNLWKLKQDDEVKSEKKMKICNFYFVFSLGMQMETT